MIKLEVGRKLSCLSLCVNFSKNDDLFLYLSIFIRQTVVCQGRVYLYHSSPINQCAHELLTHGSIYIHVSSIVEKATQTVCDTVY